MPEVSTKPNKKLALKKKYGPLSGTGWLIAGGAVAGVFIVISKIKSSSATPASGVLGGTSNMVPSGNTVTSGVSSTQSFSTMGQWVDAAIANMNANGLNATDAYNGVQNWLNGVCVSAAQYTALGSVITSQGLPPGYSTGMPSLTVCPESTTPPPTTSSSGSGSSSSSSGSGSSSSSPSSSSSSLVDAISKTTGQIISGFKVNPTTGQTFATSTGTAIPAQTSNPAAAGFNPYQALTVAQAQTAAHNSYASLISAGYSPAEAQAQAAAAASNITGYQTASTSELEKLLFG